MPKTTRDTRARMELLDRLFGEAQQIFEEARDQLSREDYQKFLAAILASTEAES